MFKTNDNYRKKLSCHLDKDVAKKKKHIWAGANRFRRAVIRSRRGLAPGKNTDEAVRL